MGCLPVAVYVAKRSILAFATSQQPSRSVPILLLRNAKSSSYLLIEKGQDEKAARVTRDTLAQDHTHPPRSVAVTNLRPVRAWDWPYLRGRADLVFSFGPGFQAARPLSHLPDWKEDQHHPLGTDGYIAFSEAC